MAAIVPTATDPSTTTAIVTSVATASTSTPVVVSVTATSAPIVSTTSSIATSSTTTSLSSPTSTSTSSSSSSYTLLISSSASSTLSSLTVISLSVSSSSLISTTSSSSSSSAIATSLSASSLSSSSEYLLSSLTSSSSSDASASASTSLPSTSDITPLVRSLIIAAAVVGSFIALVLTLGFVLRRQRHRRKTSGTLEMDDHPGRKSGDAYDINDEREKYGLARDGSGYTTKEGVFTQAMGRHHRPSSRSGGKSIEENQGTDYLSQRDSVHGTYYGGSEVSLFQPPLGVDQGRAWGTRPFTPTPTCDYQSGGFYASSSDLHRAPPSQPYMFNQHQPDELYHPYHSSVIPSHAAYQAPTDVFTTPSVIVTAPYDKSSDAQTSNVELVYPQEFEAPAYQDLVDPMNQPAMLSTPEKNEDGTSALQPGGPYSDKGIKMRVIRGFVASLEDELHVVPFTDLILHQTYDDGWCLASMATGRQGMVPRDCLSLPDVLHGSTTRRVISPTLPAATPSTQGEPSVSQKLPHVLVPTSSAWPQKEKTGSVSPEAPQLADLEFTGQFSMNEIGIDKTPIIFDDKEASPPSSFSVRAARRSSLVDSGSMRARYE